MDLLTALRAEGRLSCFVGAGGKKTTMYTLADRLDQAVVTATVRIPIFDDEVADVRVTTAPEAAIRESQHWPLGLVPAQEGEDRYRGYDPAIVTDMAEMHEGAILVKADGARMRRFKAPGSHEPQLPTAAETVVPIVSAHVVGKPLDDRLVHRVERVATLADVEPGSDITPAVIADVLTHTEGGSKDVPAGATIVPLVNMVDTQEDLEAGRAIAEAIHDRAEVPHVVLASMREPDPLVAVI